MTPCSELPAKDKKPEGGQVVTLTVPGTPRGDLERDITEAKLRLDLARAKRDRTDEKECERRLNWLLDRLNEFMEAGA